MKLFDSRKKRYEKLKKIYLKAVNEFTKLQLLAAEKPFVTERELQKIEARVAKLNQEIDTMKRELKELTSGSPKGGDSRRDSPIQRKGR
ncbi:hypothetical protein [Brevibacillus sp. NRS-1366]|uniref:hypothetical protein n=1 Tax=Brevibacillus sp. NRS-1366 TaxID=3233899 RepID=UPI003D237ADE